MTVEHRLTVGFDDVKNVVFECKYAGCSARVSISPDRAEVPEFCPSCGKEWLRKDRLTDINVRSSASVNLIENIAKLRSKDVANLPNFRILLEFDEPCGPSATEKVRP